jgi:hypothetical protein
MLRPSPLLRPIESAKLIVSFLIVCCVTAQAIEIRRFSLKTKELLGRQLYERTQRGAAPLTEPQLRAKRAAMESLRQLDKSYRIVVLNDPERDGHLVYALATSPNPDDIVVGVHYRVTVSSAGKVERVDPLARSRLVIRKNGRDRPAGYRHAGFYATNMVSTEPVETFIYLSLLHHDSCVVFTPDSATWLIKDGKITRERERR